MLFRSIIVDGLTEIVKAKCPNHVEVSHIRGGQPVYYYMISVE